MQLNELLIGLIRAGTVDSSIAELIAEKAGIVLEEAVNPIKTVEDILLIKKYLLVKGAINEVDLIAYEQVHSSILNNICAFEIQK